MGRKSFLSWSSGKDAALVLLKQHMELKAPSLLLTTVNKDFQRISMHGVRIELLKQQAKSLGLDLFQIFLTQDVSMEDYNKAMSTALKKLKAKGFSGAIFGDLFLDDLKAFRINQLSKEGFSAEFPLWKQDTKKTAMEIIQCGIKAVVVTADANRLDKNFVGRLYDEDFLNDLPEDVDWCGENGEFHTFVYDAPNFEYPIDFVMEKKIYREYKPCSKSDRNSYKKDAENTTNKWHTGFWYVDLIPSK